MNELEILIAFEPYMSMKSWYSEIIRLVAYWILKGLYTITQSVEKLFAFFLKSFNFLNYDGVSSMIKVITGFSVVVIGLFLIVYAIKVKYDKDYDRFMIFKNMAKMIAVYTLLPILIGMLISVPYKLYLEFNNQLEQTPLTISEKIFKNAHYDLRKFDSEGFKQVPTQVEDRNNLTSDTLKKVRIDEEIKKGNSSVLEKKIGYSDDGNMEAVKLAKVRFFDFLSESWYRWKFDFFTPVFSFLITGAFFLISALELVQILFKIILDYVLVYFKAPSLLFNSKYVDESLKDVLKGIFAATVIVICYILYRIFNNYWDSVLSVLSKNELNPFTQTIAWLIYLYSGTLVLFTIGNNYASKLGFSTRLSAPKDFRHFFKDLKSIGKTIKDGVSKVSSKVSDSFKDNKESNNKNSEFKSKDRGEFKGNKGSYKGKSKGDVNSKNSKDVRNFKGSDRSNSNTKNTRGDYSSSEFNPSNSNMQNNSSSTNPNFKNNNTENKSNTQGINNKESNINVFDKKGEKQGKGEFKDGRSSSGFNENRKNNDFRSSNNLKNNTSDRNRNERRGEFKTQENSLKNNESKLRNDESFRRGKDFNNGESFRKNNDFNRDESFRGNDSINQNYSSNKEFSTQGNNTEYKAFNQNDKSVENKVPGVVQIDENTNFVEWRNDNE